jgi:Na+-driven multidrug efflux pump
MIVQVLTVVLNAVLAPILIAGWITGYPMGVAGAGLASSIAVAVGVIMLAGYFHRLEKYVAFDSGAWRPRMATWGRLLRIGLPAGGEFGLMFVYMAVIYWIIRPFGHDAQAGFGVGIRLMQSLFLPAMAVAFATAPIVGQNFGARRFDRVREAFRYASTEPTALSVGMQFLHIISWNFVASGFVFTCSAAFQGLGHTMPSVWSSASRLVTFVVPALWIAAQPSFQLVELWYVSVTSVTLQALFSLWLVRREFRLRLSAAAQAVAPAQGA